MDRDDYDDDIATPSTSRSNSIDPDAELPSLPSLPPLPTDETSPAESASPIPLENASTGTAEQIDTSAAAKLNTFGSSSSSSAESDTDFVAVDKNDFDPDDSTTVSTVSFLSETDVLNELLRVTAADNGMRLLASQLLV